MLASKMNYAKLENEQQGLEGTQKEVAMNTTTKTILELGKKTKSLESDQRILSRVNEDVL